MENQNNRLPDTEKLLSRRIFKFFSVAACILVPWTIYLVDSLPYDHLDRRWNIAWSGFDVGLTLSLALTAYWGLKKSGWVIASASAAGSFLLIDAWFDFLTAKQGFEYFVSTSSAIFAELPLAFIAFWIAFRTGKYYFRK